MGHFTYNPTIDSNALKQGDILEKNAGIRSIIETVHPYFLKEDYRYFIVLTQTCDLVKRDQGRCSAEYITIAAVRPFDLLFDRYVSRYQPTEIEKKGKLCDKTHRNRVQQFLERLFNNNEEEYFYLEKDLDVDLSEPHVAFLRLSIALKADLHYATCLAAKRAELSNIFSAKLGWIVGKMYSRIGTPDWVPEICTQEEFTQKCNEIMQSNVAWLDPKTLREVRKYGSAVDQLSVETIRQIASDNAKRKKKDIAEERIRALLHESGFVSSENEPKLLRRIMNDQALAQFVWKES